MGGTPVTIFPILEKLEIVSIDNMKELCQGHLPPRSFCKLRKLTLNYLPELLNLWKDPPGNACLRNLRTVHVSTCHKLKNLLSQQTARDLGHLHELRIFNCHILQEIFSNSSNEVADGANDIMLPKLKSLELSLLPEFWSFCTKKNETSTSDAILDVPLFSNNVKFPVLEELKLRELPRVIELWDRQLMEDNFGRLKILRVIRCHHILTVIPFNLALSLHSLESLSIIFCDLVKEVYELDGFVSANEADAKSVTLPPLREFVLCGLSELQHLWWNMGPFGYLSLRNLNSFTITRCEGLKYVFSLSALKGLLQLQRLEVESCVEMKEIVATEESRAEEGSTKVVFPQLHTLRLYHLPELTRFYKENSAFYWPSLKILTIANCPQMKTFPASGIEEAIDQEGSLCATIQPLFSGKVGFPDTEELHIQWMENLVEVWHDELPDQSLSRLQVLDVRGCDKLLDVGPTNMLPRLQILTKLYIEDCGAVEDIFVPDDYIEPDSIAVSLSSLTELRLKSLPTLSRIWWDKGSQYGTLCFRNLSSLEISGCDHLQCIFSPPIVKGLVQLQRLKVDSCEMVEEIVMKECEVEDHVGVVVFPRADILELEKLPNLVIFCSMTSTLHWPLLKELRVADCPKMQIFSKGILITPKLNAIEVGNGEQLWKGDLNSTIQHLFEVKVFNGGDGHQEI